MLKWMVAGIDDVVALVGLISYILSWPLIVVVLMTKKKQPVSTVAWIMAIVALPLFGAILFLVFGINRVERRLRGRALAQSRLALLLPQLGESYDVVGSGLTEQQRALARLAERLAGSRPTIGNEVIVLHDTQKAFQEIEAALDLAQHSIHLEYYIWQPDKTGTRLRDLIIKKARDGVKVRFLYDSLGSMRLTRNFLEPMRAAGISVAAFVPGRSLRERWSINLRSHRKIVIVDGHTAFTGGMNVGDEYLGLSTHFGHWVDTHLRLKGPAVLQLQGIFAEDWLFATNETLHDRLLYPSPHKFGHSIAQVVAGGPDDDESVFHSLMFAAISEARHHVTLATSYFVPTEALVTALASAGYQGVKVRLLVSGPKTYWYTYHAGRSSYDSLLAAGIEIWEYHGGLLHSKTLTIDGAWSLVGSPNFDARSVFLNFEVGVVTYGRNVADQLTTHFEDDCRSAIKIDLAAWSERGFLARLKENWCRMFSPIL